MQYHKSAITVLAISCAALIMPSQASAEGLLGGLGNALSGGSKSSTSSGSTSSGSKSSGGGLSIGGSNGISIGNQP